MIVKLKPLDTLFFRDGKPFNLTEETLASGIFPPFPSAIYGALRSSYIAQNGGMEKFAEMAEEIGTKDKPGNFRLRRVFLEKNSVKYYPAPLDMGILNYDKAKGIISELREKDNTCAFSSNSDGIDSLVVPGPESLKVEEGRYFIAETYFKDYFHGIRRDYPLSQLDSFILPEAKVGIKRNNTTHISEEGALYRINMNRLKEDVLLDVEIGGIEGNKFTQVINIGGEGRSVYIYEQEAERLAAELNLEDIIDFIAKKGRFKVYFMTPVISQKGWVPVFEGIDNNQIRLLASAAGKPLFAGGWNIVKKMPKPMFKAVPAGSVYYYEVQNKTNLEKIIKGIHLKNHGERGEEGFGYAVVTRGVEYE